VGLEQSVSTLLAYGSCCHELQTQELYRQESLVQNLEQYRQQAIEAQDERQANSAFVHLKIASALLHHLQLWLFLKSDHMEEAWDQLVEAQESLEFALRFVDDEILRHWHMELLALEKLLFPPQRFVSVSHTFGYAECTICGEVYGDCQHVAGRMYMGQICAKRPHEIGALDHLAVVEQPRDKGCRCRKVKRDGHMYCTLTRRRLEEADEDKGESEMIVLRAR
jgi:hypothetical protein